MNAPEPPALCPRCNGYGLRWIKPDGERWRPVVCSACLGKGTRTGKVSRAQAA